MLISWENKHWNWIMFVEYFDWLSRAELWFIQAVKNEVSTNGLLQWTSNDRNFSNFYHHSSWCFRRCYHFRSIYINHFTPNIFSFNFNSIFQSTKKRCRHVFKSSSRMTWSHTNLISNKETRWHSEGMKKTQTSINNFIWHWFLIRMVFFRFFSRSLPLFYEIHFDISIVGSIQAWYARFFISHSQIYFILCATNSIDNDLVSRRSPKLARSWRSCSSWQQLRNA